MPAAIRVVNDVIIPFPSDPYADGLSPREKQVRDAFFILGFGLPLVGALMALLINEDWWRRKYSWSYQRLCTFWFISISAFATIVYYLPGQATRSTITLAVIHETIEIAIIVLLLGGTASQGLLAGFLLGLLGFTITFGLKNIAIVYWIAVTLGGIGDFLMPLLLFYGQQPILAIGSLAHVGAAASVFGEFVHNYGVIEFNLYSFFSVWFHVGFIIAGLRLQRKPEKEYPSNPMKRAVPPKVLAILFGISAFAAILVSSFFTFLAPKIGV